MINDLSHLYYHSTLLNVIENSLWPTGWIFKNLYITTPYTWHSEYFVENVLLMLKMLRS